MMLVGAMVVPLTVHWTIPLDLTWRSPPPGLWRSSGLHPAYSWIRWCQVAGCSLLPTVLCRPTAVPCKDTHCSLQGLVARWEPRCSLVVKKHKTRKSWGRRKEARARPWADCRWPSKQESTHPSLATEATGQP